MGMMFLWIFDFGVTTIGDHISVAFFGVLALLLFFACLLSFQHAEITADEIKLKSSFFKRIIKSVKWDEIIKINRRDLETVNSHGSSTYENWIVFYTDLAQSPMRNKEREKGEEPPLTIIATEKNLKIIKHWVSVYAKNAIINLDKEQKDDKLPHA